MATLSIVYKGVDEVASVSKDVAKGIDDVGEAADKAKPAGTGFFSGMLQTASGFLAANVMGAIAGQVGAFVSDGLAAARDTQQLMAQTETIIKNTGGAAGISAQEVADLASSLSDAAGQSLFGDDQIQGAENVLLKFKELKGIIPGVTQLSVDMAQSLGKDPAAAAEFLGRALQKPFDAATKLAKEGIILTDSQKATLEAFKATGDTAGAQAFLMEQLNGTYAGSAKAAADAAGGSVQFKARMGEVAENLASAALPLLDKLAGLLNEYVAPAIETVATWLGDNLPAAIDTVTEAINGIIGWFGQASTETGAFSDTLGILSDIWTQLREVIDLEIQLIQAIVVPAFEAIAQFLSDHSEEIEAILKGAWTVIKAAIDIALGLIKGIIKTALALIKGDWSGAWDAIKEMFATVWRGIKTIVQVEIDALKAILSGAWEGIKSIASAAWDGIKTLIAAKVADLKAQFDALPGQLSAIGGAIVQALWDGMQAKWNEFVSWINARIQEAKDLWNSIAGGGSGGGTPAPAPSGGGGTPPGGQGLLASRRSPVPAGGNTGGGMTIIFNIDARGAAMSATQYEKSTRKVIDDAGTAAMNRLRSGN